MEKNLKGAVIWYNDTKGYGFIRRNVHDSIFCSKKDVIDRDITKDDIVTYDEKLGRQGIRACNVKKIKYV